MQGLSKESQLTVKWGVVLSLCGAIVVGSMSVAFNHERRLTVVETQQVAVATNLVDIKAAVCEIARDLKEQERRTVISRDNQK